jgi:transposase
MAKKSRKEYDGAFKREAVRLASEPGVRDRAVEKDLGLYQGAIRHWRSELEADPQQAFPGVGRLKPQDEEVRQLRRELERTKRERDILKKAAAYFSMDAVRDLRS